MRRPISRKCPHAVGINPTARYDVSAVFVRPIQAKIGLINSPCTLVSRRRMPLW